MRSIQTDSRRKVIEEVHPDFVESVLLRAAVEHPNAVVQVQERLFDSHLDVVITETKGKRGKN